MNGRIEAYIHSDATTPNKCGAIVRVLCESDAGAKTDEFIAFCKSVALFATGHKVSWAVDDTWDGIGDPDQVAWEQLRQAEPGLIEAHANLERLLKERVIVDDIYFVELSQ